MVNENPFKIKVMKHKKGIIYRTVILYNVGVAVVFPTEEKDKNTAINETVDRAIKHLEELRPRTSRKKSR